MRYTITIEFDAEYIPSDVMDELTDTMIAQLESLDDGSLELAEDRVFPHTFHQANWSNKKED